MIMKYRVFISSHVPSINIDLYRKDILELFTSTHNKQHGDDLCESKITDNLSFVITRPFILLWKEVGTFCRINDKLSDSRHKYPSLDLINLNLPTALRSTLNRHTGLSDMQKRMYCCQPQPLRNRFSLTWPDLGKTDFFKPRPIGIRYLPAANPSEERSVHSWSFQDKWIGYDRACPMRSFNNDVIEKKRLGSMFAYSSKEKRIDVLLEDWIRIKKYFRWSSYNRAGTSNKSGTISNLQIKKLILIKPKELDDHSLLKHQLRSSEKPIVFDLLKALDRLNLDLIEILERYLFQRKRSVNIPKTKGRFDRPAVYWFKLFYHLRQKRNQFIKLLRSTSYPRSKQSVKYLLADYRSGNKCVHSRSLRKNIASIQFLYIIYLIIFRIVFRESFYRRRQLIMICKLDLLKAS